MARLIIDVTLFEENIMYGKNSHSIDDIIIYVLELISGPDRPGTFGELKDKLPFLRGDNNCRVEIGTYIIILQNTDPIAAEALKILMFLGLLRLKPPGASLDTYTFLWQ